MDGGEEVKIIDTDYRRDCCVSECPHCGGRRTACFVEFHFTRPLLTVELIECLTCDAVFMPDDCGVEMRRPSRWRNGRTLGAFPL